MARPPRLYLPPWLKLERRPQASGMPMCGMEFTKRVPKLWEQWCLALGGRNLYGEPLLRIRWSEGERVLVGEVWTKVDASLNLIRRQLEYRPTKKYPAIEERWLLEMWHPAEFYGSPEAWERQWMRRTPQGESFLLMPCYPIRGDYTTIATFQEPETGDYSEPTWSDLPGLYGVQLQWKEQDFLERYGELEARQTANKKASDDDVDEASRQQAGEMRVETMGVRQNLVSLAGVDVPQRRQVQ